MLEVGLRRVRKNVIRKVLKQRQPFYICGCYMSPIQGWYVDHDKINEFIDTLKEEYPEHKLPEDIFENKLLELIVRNWRIDQGSYENGYTPHFYIEKDLIVV